MPIVLTPKSFLRDVLVIDVDESGVPVTSNSRLADQTVLESLSSGLPAILQSPDSRGDDVAMSVPVYREGAIVSFLVLLAGSESNGVGVMEVWQPIGRHDELSLTQGFFGTMDRFQNVSSFVRFEKGAGLPGQVWRNLSFVVHDNLPRHSGFLRAAGASAEALQVAIGIPVFGNEFLASALLISSDATPIARGYEVWRNAGDHFLLESVAYQRLEQSLMLEESARVPLQGSFPGLAVENGGAVCCSDPEVVYSGRPCQPSDRCKGVAVPFFEDGRVTNVLTLLF